MIWKASSINGYAIAASDGKLGAISDFLFEDVSWMVRWLVVDTGNWLPGRKVLLSPSVLGNPYAQSEEFSVNLTMQQVKDSPAITTDAPVSRQMEATLYDYYGWSPFLISAGAMFPVPPSLGAQFDQGLDQCVNNGGDPHLRSVCAVTGYHIHASDGDIGHVADFLVDDTGWNIGYLIVDTGNWWPGQRVLISPRTAQKIDWDGKRVNLAIDRRKVKESPPYDPAALIDAAYEQQLREHYGESGRILEDVLMPGGLLSPVEAAIAPTPQEPQ